MESIKNYIKKKGQFIPIERINFKVESYKPRRNKFKLLALFGFVGLLFATPCSNWLLIPTMKLLNKYPLYMYK